MQKKFDNKDEPDTAPDETNRSFPLSFIEDTFDGLFIVRRGKVRFHNPGFAEIFGCKDMKEAIGTDVSELVSRRDREQVNLIAEGRHNFMARRFDGFEFEAEAVSRRVTYQGKPAIQVVTRDVSEPHRLERQLRHSQKMEVIGTMASGIAHDFNNILSIIMGYIELSFDTRTNIDVVRQNLKQALKASHRAKDLVQQILTFSRRGEKEKAPVKFTSLVKEIIKLIRATLPSTIEIHHVPSEQEYLVLAEPTQMHQVLMNLCTNAAQAMKQEGGVLEIVLSDFNRDMKAVQDEPLPPSPYLRLTVSDTGHGIAPEIKKQIFDPFFTTKKEGEGTGMGLAVVQGIVKNHDGELSVESEPGKGTSFHLFLPLLHEEPENMEEKNETDIPRGREQVLLVEDEKVLLNIAGKMLECLGYRVVARGDGKEALDAFRAGPGEFDVVITDLTMPGMTGIQLARELIKITPEIPIIMCTGFNEEIDRQHLQDLGMQGFIMKPYSAGKLSIAVREILD